jgi:hypothetical protein
LLLLLGGIGRCFVGMFGIAMGERAAVNGKHTGGKAGGQKSTTTFHGDLHLSVG